MAEKKTAADTKIRSVKKKTEKTRVSGGVKKPEKQKKTAAPVVSQNIINGLLAVAVALMLFNMYTIGSIKSSLGAPSIISAKFTQNQLTGDPVQDAINAVIPTGSAGIYGESLGISYDDVTGGLNVLARLESTIKYDDLTDAQKARYVKIATTPYTACEFCCGIGARGFGTSDGRIACGCSHNLAFSGLTKYILKNHENDYTDDDIFNEIQKWKALFFPKQMIQRYMQLQEAGGDMSALEDLPGMVGGC